MGNKKEGSVCHVNKDNCRQPVIGVYFKHCSPHTEGTVEHLYMLACYNELSYLLRHEISLFKYYTFAKGPHCVRMYEVLSNCSQLVVSPARSFPGK